MMSERETRARQRDVSRRRFLQNTVLAGAALAVGAPSAVTAMPLPSATWPQTPGSISTLSEHLMVYHGAIHTGIIRDRGRALVIDFGDGRVSAALSQLGASQVEHLLFTHYHRDQMCGAYRLARTAQVAVPATERAYFADPAAYWNDDSRLYRVFDSFRPCPLMPTRPLPVHRELHPGDRLSFGPAELLVLDTPGHTDGSISFLVEVDGQRVVFSGDCLAGPGQIWNVHSLQRGFERDGARVGGYHGFMGDRWRLAEGLQRIRDAAPAVIVPSHGSVIRNPSAAIDATLAALEHCYENYVSISALRYYFPGLFADYAGKPGQMPFRPGSAPPACLRHIGTTWILISQTGGALVMDVGSPDIVDQLKQMQADGVFQRIEALWVTHYHFDHTDGIAAFQREFDCPCITDLHLADVLTRPAAWRLPCLDATPIRIDRPLRDRYSWQWHEFRLTSFFYPGQTLYHSGLLAETGDLRMFFAGDSHTPSGIDDYCAQNRNLLGPNVGFQYCLSLLERLQPTHIFNCHVNDAFSFTPEEIEFMRRQLDQRERLFGKLLPWDHANFGLDPSWARVDPYRQDVQAGETVHCEIVITNHSNDEASYACRAVLPGEFGGAATSWSELQIVPKEEERVRCSWAVPTGTPAGRYVVPIDIRSPRHMLPQFTETIVDVRPAAG